MPLQARFFQSPQYHVKIPFPRRSVIYAVHQVRCHARRNNGMVSALHSRIYNQPPSEKGFPRLEVLLSWSPFLQNSASYRITTGQ